MKECCFCGGSYSGKNKLYCSVQCHKSARKESPSKYPYSKECEACGKHFDVKSSNEDQKRFCNRSCAAAFNNRKFIKRAAKGVCRSCPSIIPSGKVWCVPCLNNRMEGYSKSRSDKISKWLSGDWSGSTAKGVLSKTVREYLINKANNYCQNDTCILDGKQLPTHPVDKRSVLQIDHINGMWDDNRPDNLIALCPTCHALTPTYGSRNRGNGRAYRRDQYRSVDSL